MTAVYQPLDHCVIATLKSSYKRKLLTSLVDAASNFETLQCMSSKIPAGHAGLKHGCLLQTDLAEIVKDIWKALSPSVIADSWRHAHCLPSRDKLWRQIEAQHDIY